MEDNTGTIAAICIDDKTNDKNLRGITEGNKYKIKQSPNYTNYYEIINDLGESDAFFKTRFKIIDQQILLDGGIVNYYKDGDIELKVEGEKVEDVIIIKCIDNKGYEGHLELNKKYPVLEEDETYYFIEDDILKGKTGYKKDRFKPVEPQNEVKGINYEEEYNKLKKENERLNTIVDGKQEVERENEELKKLLFDKGAENSKSRNKVENLEKNVEELQKVNKEINESRELIYKESQEEIKQLKDRINKYQDSILEKQSQIEELKEERNNYKEIIESKNKNIEELKNKIKRLNADQNSLYNRIDDNNEKIYELKKQSNQGYIEQMNITLNEKNEQLELLGKTANEYYYNWLESQNETKEERDKNRILKNKVEALKESVTKLTELL